MKFKHWDVVKPKNWDNKAEALVDLQIWQSVYVTPRGKMSLAYPERYVINESHLLLKQNDKYKLTYKDIEKDYFNMFGEKINLNNTLDINELTPWDILSLDLWILDWCWPDWNIRQYMFKEYVNWKAIFESELRLYEITQDDLDKVKNQIDSIIARVYWLSASDIEICDEESKDEEQQINSTPREMPLDFNQEENA